MTTETGARAVAPDALHLARWTINSGSNVQSRGAVVIASGDHQWEATAEGLGPVEALYRAVDRALQLAGIDNLFPRLEPEKAAPPPSGSSAAGHADGPPSGTLGAW